MENRINYNYVIIGGLVLIILGFIGLNSDAINSEWDTAIQIFQSIGYLSLGLGVLRKKRSEKEFEKAKKFIPLFFMMLAFVSPLNAQTSDYSKQVQALEKSFESKNLEALKDYISPELKFGPIPAQNTPAILTNIVNNFPKLLKLEIRESKKGEALVFYNFEGMGESESKILFDDSGKITKIEHFEEIIMQQIRAQQALQNSVQQPNPGELGEKYQSESIEFKSKDGLAVSGNLYEIDSRKPVILLLHQANYNKHEYADIAPKLNEMGYNVLAIDQRSGGPFAGKMNETFDRTQKEGLGEIQMTDAEQDIEAAVNYLHKKYDQKVTVWGSSYSSSLALFVAADNNKVNGVIAFSPGNYFGDAKPKLSSVFKKLEKPFLVTSSKEEATDLSKELEGVNLNENQSQFTPESDGFHGSRAVWEGQKGAEEYWSAITEFLNMLNSKG
ncbi:MAG: alpha/beta fold hydrolase [Balneola sp.]